MKKDIPIIAYKCKKCGRIHYPFHDRCLNCKSREFEKIHPEGEAKLLTFTTIYNLPWGFDLRYLVIGVAEFDNKVKAMGQITVDSQDKLKIGMKVHPTWDVVRVQTGENVYGLKFVPIK